MTELILPVPGPDAPVALVTGGGRGIGRACALRLAAAGHKVAVVSRSLDEIDEVAALIHQGGGFATSAVCDVADPDSVEFALKMCVDRLGAVDVLVNNAGVASAVPFLEMSLSDFRRMLDVNLVGTFLCTRAVLPRMVERKHGRIINVASTAGLFGTRYTAHYCAAKHGVVGMTRALALEVARAGVTVNAVCPGWVDTDLLGSAVENISAKTGRTVAESREALLKGIPTRRFTSPERVAELVGFLASAAAADITGTTLTVDGGETAGH
ncbi:MAG: SDR family oxidoreductase [Deltaproteobacteria bacterium]|nr:SDR family oxidoreductase [Deltaproteobacteria bacterium]